MGLITRLRSGARPVRIRRKGHDPHRRARQAEGLVDQGLEPETSSVSRLQTFGDRIDLHIADMLEAGKPLRREAMAAPQGARAAPVTIPKIRHERRPGAKGDRWLALEEANAASPARFSPR